MKFEHIHTTDATKMPQYVPSTEELARSFAELTPGETQETHIFADLEHALEIAGFVIATQNQVAQKIFSDANLFCRSEEFSKVIDSLTHETDVVLMNHDMGANMCHITSGEGLRTAMQEGFSTKDVAGKVKTVITFRGNHLDTKIPVPKENYIWRTKPKTASLALVGKGRIPSDDIVMISFRFPISLFPEYLLTEKEQGDIEESGIKFIVRNYIKTH